MVAEKAIQAHILELSAEQLKNVNVNANVSEEDLTLMVDEALQRARKRCDEVNTPSRFEHNNAESDLTIY